MNFAAPTRTGVAYAFIHRMGTNAEAATAPGSVNGRITRRNKTFGVTAVSRFWLRKARRAIGSPEMASRVQDGRRQWHRALLAALADDTQQLMGAADRAHFQGRGLADAQ